MNRKPIFGLSVLDLQRSIHFYRDQIGLTVDADIDIPDTAILITPQNTRVVLAGPSSPDLADQHAILQPCDRLFIQDPDFEQRLARIAGAGEVRFQVIERPWGDRGIEAECPDGYGVSLWKVIQRTHDEILDLLQAAGYGFRALIEDLSDDDLLWKHEPDAWSVREVIHHVADASLTTLHVARTALAEPGRAYQSNPYDQRLYARELRYQLRDVEPSLQFIESSHDMLRSLIHTIPEAWRRSVCDGQSGETSVETCLEMLAVHNLEHLEQINDIRGRLGYRRSQIFQ